MKISECKVGIRIKANYANEKGFEKVIAEGMIIDISGKEALVCFDKEGIFPWLHYGNCQKTNRCYWHCENARAGISIDLGSLTQIEMKPLSLKDFKRKGVTNA